MLYEVKGRERDGFGKLARVDAECLVEYFDSRAGGGREICQVPKAAVVRKRLGRNTRVYVYRELKSCGRVGRVQKDDDEVLYVRFRQKKDSYVPYIDAFVCWKRPSDNLSQFLARFVTETPQYHNPRSAFLQSDTEQRCAAFGIPFSLSSSVELNAHQIGAGRRVLNNPSRLYPLVDKVRLDKARAVADYIHR